MTKKGDEKKEYFISFHNVWLIVESGSLNFQYTVAINVTEYPDREAQ